MADETKITLKMGAIAAMIAALIVSAFGCFFNFHGRITVLETNYMHVSATLTEIKTTVSDIRQDQIDRKKNGMKY